MFSFFELAFCPSFNFLFDSSSSAPLASLASSNASSSVRFFEDFFSSPSCLLSWSLPFLLSLVPFLSPSPLPSELNKYFFVGRGFFAFTDSNNQSRLTFSHVLTSQAVLSIHVSIQLSNDICMIFKKNHTFSTFLLHIFLRRHQVRTLRRDTRAKRGALVFYQGLEVRCSYHELHH